MSPSPPGRLEGKRAVITGFGSGIGAASAVCFAKEGAAVAIIDIDAPALDGVATAISAAGGRVVVHTADVSDEAQIAGAIDSAAAEFGGLDIVVANAGIEPTQEDNRVDRLDAEVWRRVVDVNLTGVFLTCKHGIRHLLEAGGGAVICTASPTGLLRARPRPGRLQLEQGGRVRTYPRDGKRLRAARNPGQWRAARVHRHAAQRPPAVQEGAEYDDSLRGIPMGRVGPARGGRRCHRLPRLARRVVCERCGLGGGRRDDRRVTPGVFAT